MGCGCGGRRNSGRTVTTAPARTTLQAGVTARQVQTQSNQRQDLVQRAQERLQQQSANIISRNSEIERKRKIQVSLRNRNSRTTGNQ